MSEPNLASSSAAESNDLALQEQTEQAPDGQQLSMLDAVTNNVITDSLTTDCVAIDSVAIDRTIAGTTIAGTTIPDDRVTDSAVTDGAIAETEAHQKTATPLTEILQRHLATWAAAQYPSNTIDPVFFEALLQQLTLALEPQQQRWQDEQAALQAELKQARSLFHEQIERIRHLEQALDQSLASVSEMRLQVVDQHLLEAQLAATEDISNIQQQAIVRLKLQLSQQQQALTAQLTETQARDRSLQALLITLETLTQTQQQALAQLQRQIAGDRAEVQAYYQRLKAQLEQRQTVQTHQEQPLAPQPLDALAVPLMEPLAHALSHSLRDRQLALEQLETELQQTHATLQAQQAWLGRLPQSCQLNGGTAESASPAIVVPESVVPETAALAIAPDLITAHARIAALEAQAAKQTTTQAMLRHACQELEEERDRQQARLTELESQTTDMQEQILRQAQQASEYEAAIQHWKDRCFSNQSGMLELQELLDQALPDQPAALSELLTALLAAADTESSSPTLQPTASANREKVDLPDFLLRRRNYKTHRS